MQIKGKKLRFGQAAAVRRDRNGKEAGHDKVLHGRRRGGAQETGSTLHGLESGEAEIRLEKNGPNKLAEPERESLLLRFAKQLKDPMIIVLLAAALVSGITAFYAGESFADVIIILAVVVINAVLGVYQESKAEKAIEALQKMSAAVSKVYRDGKKIGRAHV